MLLRSRRVAIAGTAVVVVTDDTEIADQAAVVIADLGDAPPADDVVEHRVAVRSVPSGFTVCIETDDLPAEELGVCDTRAVALGLVVWAIGRIVPRARGARVVLHGAVVAGPRGAVVACGASGAGKTTVAAAAAIAGLTFLSDDVAVIDPQQLVVAPHARSLLLRQGTRVILGEELAAAHIDRAPVCGDGEWVVPASWLGATVARGAVPLVALVEIERGPEPSIRPLSRADLLHRMIGHCTTIRSAPSDDFAALTRLATEVPGHVLTVDPALGAVELLERLVGVG